MGEKSSHTDKIYVQLNENNLSQPFFPAIHTRIWEFGMRSRHSSTREPAERHTPSVKPYTVFYAYKIY